MRALDDFARRQTEKAKTEKKLHLAVPELDKAQKQRILTLRRPDPRDLAQYASFLSSDGTGIFKIFPDDDCSTEQLISVGAICSDFVPESSDFSFRQHVYIESHYRDLGFYRDHFLAGSFFSHGLLVELGTIPIESVSADEPRLKALLRVPAATSIKQAHQLTAQIAEGALVEGKGGVRSLKATENTTYAVRTVAYRLGDTLAPLGPATTMTEMRLMSLSFDRREDITVVFRVIRRDERGGLTIVWKEISRQPSPKLKFGSGEPMIDPTDM